MKLIWKALLVLIGLLIAIPSAEAVRIKDIAEIEGVRFNKLVGYGLIIGLNGTGDKAGTEFTIQSLVTMLERMGIKVDRSKVKVENVAAVMVTADLPPFARPGSRLDALVSKRSRLCSGTGSCVNWRWFYGLRSSGNRSEKPPDRRPSCEWSTD